jgi:hypothetical protein
MGNENARPACVITIDDSMNDCVTMNCTNFLSIMLQDAPNWQFFVIWYYYAGKDLASE